MTSCLISSMIRGSSIVLKKKRSFDKKLAFIPKQKYILEDINNDNVYTDGSLRLSEKYMGIGLWYGENDDRNNSYRVFGKLDSNRAELGAIYTALTQTHIDKQLMIYTDSSASMHLLGNHYYNDKTNLKFDKLLYHTSYLIDIRKEKTFIIKVKGHSKIHGNVMADTLAKNAQQNKYIILPDNNLCDVLSLMKRKEKVFFPVCYL